MPDVSPHLLGGRGGSRLPAFNKEVIIMVLKVIAFIALWTFAILLIIKGCE